MNLYDILLARCICSNKEDESITVTPLEVTENGEYEAEEGYAYNPVTVNVSGGGGDFSTAKVTIVPKESTDSFGLQSCNDESEEYNTSAFQFEFEGNTVYSLGAATYETALETTLIYSGDSVDVIPGNKVDSVSGDAVYDSETNKITITGDCTITGWFDE